MHLAKGITKLDVSQSLAVSPGITTSSVDVDADGSSGSSGSKKTKETGDKLTILKNLPRRVNVAGQEKAIEDSKFVLDFWEKRKKKKKRCEMGQP